MQNLSTSRVRDVNLRSLMDNKLHVSLLEDWQQVSRLQGEWNTLLRQSRSDSLFLTWEWISAWATIAQQTTKPLIICVRNTSEELLGIAPFYLTTLRLKGGISYRVLRVMADYATGAEYPDWIVRVDVEAAVSQAIADTLIRIGQRWDCLWMPNVAGWTGAVDRILRPCQEQRLLWRSRPCEFGAVPLPDTMDLYVRSLSSNKRQQMKAEQKRFRAKQSLVIQRCQNAEQLPRLLDALFDLHYRRWQVRGEEGSFRRKPQLVEFYKQFVPRALMKGWLWLFGLQDQGDYKAIQLGYVYNHVFHQIQEGFDPEYEPGAGNFLRAYIIEACTTAGIRTFDFLGEMTEHKRRWLAEKRVGCDLFIGQRKLKNRPLFSLGIWPTGRFLRPTA